MDTFRKKKKSKDTNAPYYMEETIFKCFSAYYNFKTQKYSELCRRLAGFQEHTEFSIVLDNVNNHKNTGLYKIILTRKI